MARYAAFLGSVNVGGNRLAMADLRAALADAGFAGVATVTASGNVLFDHPGAADTALAEAIGDCVAARFGFRMVAVVREADEIARVIAANPFADGEDRLVHAMLLDGPIGAEAFGALLADHRGVERIAPGDRVLYIDYVDGAGRSALTKSFIERRIGRQGTARNMRSLARILAAMRP